MNGRRVETMHNTREQVTEYLRDALAIVDELDVLSDLRTVAFTKAADLVASKSITVEAVSAGILGGVRAQGL